MDPLGEANKVLGVLQDVQNACEEKRHNEEVMRELGLFIENMKQAVEVLERRTLDRFRARIPTIVHSGTTASEDTCSSIADTLLCIASDELVKDLERAAESLQEVLKVPRNSWNVDTLVERLRSVREIVIRSFQSKLHINKFDTTMDGESPQQQESLRKIFSPGPRASKIFPNSVRQNFSSGAELELPDTLRQRVLPDELRHCLPRPGVDVSPAQTSQRMEFDDDSSSDDEVVLHVNDLVPAQASHRMDFDDDSSSDEIVLHGSSRVGISQTIRNHPRAIGNTETEAFFADVLANLEVMRAEASAAQTESAGNKLCEDEISDWFEDPITGEIMTDPIKCTDGRTYDRWTVIDHNLVKCPYDPSMLDFHIAFDDIDVRARLFRAFPEKEHAYRSRRHGHRLKAFEHVRKGENRDALIKLNQVLQWSSQDEECKTARDQVLLLLQPSNTAPLPCISLVEPASPSSRSIRGRFRRCSITSWLWRRRSASPRPQISSSLV